MEKEILKHLLKEYPNEGCGIILNKQGKLVWLPCKNVAEVPLKNFKISPQEYVKATLQGDIHAIVHSHPNGSCNPSDDDKAQSNYFQVPYIIYSMSTGEKYEYIPEYKKQPLLGRMYEWGKTDCWTIVRDFYKQEYSVTLPMLEFEENFYSKGINYFDDLIKPWGGVEVTEPEKGDIIYFQTKGSIPNHCGIYIGNDQFIHQPTLKLSCTEFLPRWRKYIKRYVRCKKSI